MNSSNDIFDKIRIKKSSAKKEAEAAPPCDFPNCKEKGRHRAPKGRGHEKEYFNFCVKHVREYNLSYNYFSGLPDDAVASFQKSASTGHRPTWTMGATGTGSKPTGADGQRNPWAEGELPRVEDPMGLFNEKTATRAKAPTPRKPVGNAERAAFMTLNLDIGAGAAEIKTKFKAMAKRFHPDANGGDKTYEAKMSEIIVAYNQLKKGGFC